MSERRKYPFPEIPGLRGETIEDQDVIEVMAEVERLIEEQGNQMNKIARIFDASPEKIQDKMRARLRGTQYATY